MVETSPFESAYGGQFTLSLPVHKTRLCCNTPYRRSTIVSLETYPFYSFVLPSFSCKRTHVTETKHLKFERCCSKFYKMAERMDIENFFKEIDPDLF